MEAPTDRKLVGKKRYLRQSVGERRHLDRLVSTRRAHAVGDPHTHHRDTSCDRNVRVRARCVQLRPNAERPRRLDCRPNDRNRERRPAARASPQHREVDFDPLVAVAQMMGRICSSSRTRAIPSTDRVSRTVDARHDRAHRHSTLSQANIVRRSWLLRNRGPRDLRQDRREHVDRVRLPERAPTRCAQSGGGAGASTCAVGGHTRLPGSLPGHSHPDYSRAGPPNGSIRWRKPRAGTHAPLPNNHSVDG